MEFTVKDLLKQHAMKDAAYIGDSSLMNHVITGVTVMETPDIAEWLKGGEMLITSLYPIRSFTGEQKKEWIEYLSIKKVSALIVKIDRVYDQIPSEIVEASKLYQMPIIQIPKEVPYIDVMYPVMEALFNNQVTNLKYFKDAHDQFTALSLADTGKEKIIETLGELIGNPVAIYDRDFRSIAVTNNATSLFYTVKRMEEEGVIQSKFPFYWQFVIFPGLQNRESRQMVVPIETINHLKMYLVISELNKRITNFDIIAIENAATALSLELVKQFAVAEVEKKYNNDLIDDLISGKIMSLHDVYDRATVLDWDLKGRYAAVVFHLSGNAMEKDNFKRQQEFYNLLNETIHFYLPKGIIRGRSDQSIVLWKIQQNSQDDKKYMKEIKQTAKDIQLKFSNYTKEIIVQVGIGNSTASILDIPKSYKEAQDALELGQIYHSDDFIIGFNDLGIFRLLYQFEDLATLKNFIPETLEKLLVYQHSNKSDLVNTLKVYLQCNQNAAKTAQKLFVHYKTIAYRMDRIKEVSGIDFENAEEMLAIQVGLKIVDIIKKYDGNDKR